MSESLVPDAAPGGTPSHVTEWEIAGVAVGDLGVSSVAAAAAAQAGTPASKGGTAVTTAGVAAAEEKEWWDDPSLPWHHRPGRQDIVCLSWLGFVGIYGLAMVPLRAWLLGLHPAILTAALGSRTGTVALGALHRIGQAPYWLWAVLAGSIMSVKFDWIYWWAGKLWGHGILEVWAGRSDRAKRNYALVERWATKFGVLSMFLAYIPVPLPTMQVVFVLAGSGGMRLRRFLLLDFLASGAWLTTFFTVGWILGDPAVRLLRHYSQYANEVSVTLVAVVIVVYIVNTRRQRREARQHTSAAAKAHGARPDPS